MVSLPSASRLLGAALAFLPSVSLALSAADYYVDNLPGAPAEPPMKMHAGHIEVTPEHNGNLFFWHFQNQHIANKQRTLIWLNGGPGCSSEDGALMEVGPYRVADDEKTLVYNNGSWSEFANLLFVDNPVGTGFSYVNTDSYVHELTEMADQFILFMEKYFEIFPEYQDDAIYFAGESYAGQHIPYIAKAILDRNRKRASKPWNLEGLLIGNGWISPKEQYEAYLSYAYKRDMIKEGSAEGAKLQEQWNKCKSLITADPDRVDYQECERILRDMLAYTSTIGSDGTKQCYNMYDIRLRDEHPACGMNWPPDLKNIKPYLRNPSVISALHINKNKVSGWEECTSAVGSAMRNLESRASVTLLPDILKEVPILLFSGADDYICNHLGTEAFLGNLEWNGGKGFELTPGTWAPRRDWTVEGAKAGFWQEARNLTYVLFEEASHMVPFDHPRRSRDMLDRFMGVDISSIGGSPVDSRIDGEKGPQTSVEGGTPADEEHEQEVEDAKWHAYRRSGEIVLVIAIAAFCMWAYIVWRNRRKRRGYRGLAGGPADSASASVEAFRSGDGDVEAGELDELAVSTPREEKRYSIGSDSDDERESGPSSSK